MDCRTAKASDSDLRYPVVKRIRVIASSPCHRRGKRLGQASRHSFCSRSEQRGGKNWLSNAWIQTRRGLRQQLPRASLSSEPVQTRLIRPDCTLVQDRFLSIIPLAWHSSSPARLLTVGKKPCRFQAVLPVLDQRGAAILFQARQTDLAAATGPTPISAPQPAPSR